MVLSGVAVAYYLVYIAYAMKNSTSPTAQPVRHGTAIVSAIAGMTVGGAVAANAARDALFLDVFPASDLPWVMIPSAIATLLFAVVASALLRWLGPNRFGPGLYLLCGAGVVSTLAIAPASAEVAAVFLYLMVAAIVGSLAPAMWAMLNERYNPTSGKAAFSRIAWASYGWQRAMASTASTGSRSPNSITTRPTPSA